MRWERIRKRGFSESYENGWARSGAVGRQITVLPPEEHEEEWLLWLPCSANEVEWYGIQRTLLLVQTDSSPSSFSQDLILEIRGAYKCNRCSPSLGKGHGHGENPLPQQNVPLGVSWFSLQYQVFCIGDLRQPKDFSQTFICPANPRRVLVETEEKCQEPEMASLLCLLPLKGDGYVKGSTMCRDERWAQSKMMLFHHCPQRKVPSLT